MQVIYLFIYLFIYFLENTLCHFMQVVSLGDNFSLNAKALFLEK